MPYNRPNSVVTAIWVCVILLVAVIVLYYVFTGRQTAVVSMQPQTPPTAFENIEAAPQNNAQPLVEEGASNSLVKPVPPPASKL